MPFAPFPTPDDVLVAGRLSHIPLPLSGATLSDCELDDVNKIILPPFLVIDVTGSSSDADLDTRHSIGQSFLLAVASTIVKIKKNIKKVGSPTGMLGVSIQTDSSGVPSGTLVGSEVSISFSEITTTYVEYEFELNAPVNAETTYWVVFRMYDTSGLDSSNKLVFQYFTTSVYDSGNRAIQTTGAWSAQTTRDEQTKIYTKETTSGTATFRITPAQLAQWKQFITYVKLNTNNSATYTIKDTSGNTITGPTALSNGLNTIDISSLVSAELYKEIDVVVTLSRVSASDTSPELHYAAVLVEGQDELAWRRKSIFTTAPTTTHYTNTITNTTGAGYLTTIINGHTASVNVSVQIDSGTIYQYTIPTGGYVVFGGYGRRFNSSLIVKADQTAVYVEGVLD